MCDIYFKVYTRENQQTFSSSALLSRSCLFCCNLERICLFSKTPMSLYPMLSATIFEFL